MSVDEPAEPPALPSYAGSRRDLAVARVLDPARSRAETRLQRFLDAALELLSDSPTKEFTVQEVVERSGQSLRSFYQYFDGKHELLLALFEDALHATAVHLDAAVASEDDPLDRLRRFVVEYHRLCRPSRLGGSADRVLPPVLADFAQQLLTQHPEDAARAFAPLRTRLEELLAAAADAGVIRPTLPRGTAGMLLQALMFSAFAKTIGALPGAQQADRGEELWDLFMRGLRPADVA